MIDSFNFESLKLDTKLLDSFKNNLGTLNQNTIDVQEKSSIKKIANKIAIKRKEQEDREKRMLQISEERLEYDKLKLFLLSSVNKDQKFILEKIDSLIDTIKFGNKIVEGNLSVIEEELISLKKSTENINEGFIKLIQNKMIEYGVEEAIKFLFIGLKILFLPNN